MIHIPLRRTRRTSPENDTRAVAGPSLGLRLSVLLHRRRLDEQLAEGCGRGVADELTLRAHQLSDPVHRAGLAGALRRIVERAERPSGGLSSTVPPCRDAVIERREGLLGLADRLDGAASMSASAVARVELLLQDGTGPLFSARADRSIADGLWWVADAWERGCAVHDWRCPVISKLDCEHVTWTCAHCGATAVSADGGTRPA